MLQQIACPAQSCRWVRLTENFAEEKYSLPKTLVSHANGGEGGGPILRFTPKITELNFTFVYTIF